MREPDRIMGKHDSRAIRYNFGQRCIRFGSCYVSIRYSNNINRVILKLHRRVLVTEHLNGMTLQSVRDSAFAINVVMVPKDGETAKRRYNARKNRRYHAWRYTATAEWLHVDVITAEQHDIGNKTRRFSNDGVEACDVARMRARMKIG